MAYEPPIGTQADFDFIAYTPPAGTQADFDFTDKLFTDLGAEITGSTLENTDVNAEITGKKLEDDINAEVSGKDIEETDINTEISGAGLPNEISAEITGADLFNIDINAEILGSGTPTDISSEITGRRNRWADINAEITGDKRKSDINVQIAGKRFIPLQRTYRIIVKDTDGTPIGEFHNFRNLRFGKRLNNFGEASFEVPANDPKVGELINLRKYTVWVYMQEDAGMTLVWAGEQAARMGNLENDGNNWCEIYCFDWLEQLNSRYTPFEIIYDQVDAGAIAVDLIEKTQDGWDEYGEPYGDLGITIGEVEETIDRDKTFVNQNIMEAIISLSDVVSGFDFEITHEKVFNAYSVLGVDRTDEIVLEYGLNIDSCKVVEDFTHPANRAIVLGEVIGEESLQRIERDDSASQEVYSLREYLTSETDASELANFQDRGDAINQKYGLPLVKIDATMVKGSNPSITQFGVGDVVWVRIKSGVYDINEQYRIFEWNISFDTENAEQLSLVLGKFTLG